MPNESTQEKLSRNRPPRVQITYDVEVGDALETKELPFVLGVLGDYSGHNNRNLPKPKERKFVQIDHDNFNDVMKGMAPGLALRVDNTLQDDGTQLGVELKFQTIEDFEPDRVAAQVEPLRQLMEARSRLADLRNKIAGNNKLEELLDEIVRDTEKLRALSGKPAHAENGEQS